MALIPPFFLDCVVAIGFDNGEGKPRYVATGFIYGKLLTEEGTNKTYKTYLVTNKHVFGKNATAWLRFNPSSDEPAREFKINLLDNQHQKTWLSHPDSEVDLAVIGINAPILQEQGIHFGFFRDDQHIIDREQALELGISEGDGIFVLGFPMGMIGERRNFVIVRQGAIARIRDTLAGNSKEFLVDTLIFPGNSGGPVVLRPETISIHGTKAILNAYLLGIVSSYVPYTDIAISAQTQRPRITFEENSGLATVIPIDYLKNIIDDAISVTDIVKQEPPVEVNASNPDEPSN